ncbi:MAG: hypothetical protein ABFC84_02470, partial [Veillonellales bacterium]
REQKISEHQLELDNYKASGINVANDIQYLRDNQGMETVSLFNKVASLISSYSYDRVEAPSILSPSNTAFDNVEYAADGTVTEINPDGVSSDEAIQQSEDRNKVFNGIGQEFSDFFSSPIIENLPLILAGTAISTGIELQNSANPLGLSMGSSNATKVVDGINVVEGKVGGKIPIEEFTKIRSQSIHNANAEASSMTLGKYTPTVENGVENWAKPGPDSYIAKAGDKSTYFDLGSEWENIQSRYNLTGEEMFNYFNKPALDDAVRNGKTIQFSHKPDLEIYKGSYLAEEWNYLKNEYGYSILIEGEGGIWYAK